MNQPFLSQVTLSVQATGTKTETVLKRLQETGYVREVVSRCILSAKEMKHIGLHT